MHIVTEVLDEIGLHVFYIAAILTAGNPEMCGFMADECLLAIPEIEGIDYTTKELINFVEQLKSAANRLNKEGKERSVVCK